MAYDSDSRKVILYGGVIGTDDSRETWAYDPAANIWTKLAPVGDPPSASIGAAMVYDPTSHKVILFGGYGVARFVNETWAYDPAANTWTKLDPSGEVPSPRSFHAMVYDSRSGKVILFGGSGNDTWAYDSAANAWTELHPTGELPPPRSEHAMAYDSKNNKVILFGGSGPDAEDLNDTWAYDPAANTWTKLDPKGDSPPGRHSLAMVYDPAGGRVILFGGWEMVGPDGLPVGTLGDTWAYDYAANTWTQLHPRGDLPFDRQGHAMVYDSGSKRVIMFGGQSQIVDDPKKAAAVGDTWAYDPAKNTWIDLKPSGLVPSQPVLDTPPARTGASMVYIPSTGKVILFGGMGQDEQNPPTGTWAYDPTANTWTELHTAGKAPPDVFGYPMVYDPESGRALLFDLDPWAYDPAASTWTSLETAGEFPDGRVGYAAAYDSEKREVIVFGGGAILDMEPGNFTNPWAYDLATHTWRELPPKGDLPGALQSHAMVYDPVGKKVILFGGSDHKQGDKLVNDTWAYDPAANTWTKLQPSGDLPPARAAHAMVYDPVGKKVILFGGAGGESGDQPLNDTWAYDPAANTWTNLQPGGDLPAARAGHCMVYDTSDRKMILFGGSSADGLFNDTWAYDPAANTWTKLAGSAAPSKGDLQGASGAAVDASAKSLVRNAMTAIESAFVDERTFDPGTMTPAALRAIEPSITFIAGSGTSVATAPTAEAATYTVNYFGTATKYAVGTVSRTGGRPSG